MDRTAAEPTAATFALDRLEPGRYAVSIPFRERAEVEVEAGLRTSLELVLDPVGWIEVRLDSGAPVTSGYTMLQRLGDGLPPTADGREVGAEVFVTHDAGGPSVRFPFQPGRYVARQSASEDGSARLLSDPFEVRSGATTAVVLREERVVRIPARAVHAVTGKPVSLEGSDWNTLEFRAQRAGTPVHAVFHFVYTEGGVRASVELPLGPEPVAVTAPEHPLWVFEPIDPVEVVEGAELVLRVTPR